MFHLFNRTYVTSVNELTADDNRIIVGRDVSDEYIGSTNDELSRLLKIGDIPRTLHHTRRVDWFVEEKLPDLLPTLMGKTERLRIFADNEAYIKLCAYWIRTLFPHMTRSEFKEMMFINQIAASATEVSIPWAEAGEFDKVMNTLFTRYQPDPKVQATIHNRLESLSFEYRLIGWLWNRQGSEALATTIRHNVVVVVNELISEMVQAVNLFFYSPQLAAIFQRQVRTPGSFRSPLTQLSELKILNNKDLFLAHVLNPETRADAFAAFRHDVSHLITLSMDVDSSQTTVDELTALVGLLCIEDDTLLVEEYLSALETFKRPGALVPSDNLGALDVNLIYWMLEKQRSSDTTKPFWIDQEEDVSSTSS